MGDTSSLRSSLYGAGLKRVEYSTMCSPQRRLDGVAWSETARVLSISLRSHSSMMSCSIRTVHDPVASHWWRGGQWLKNACPAPRLRVLSGWKCPELFLPNQHTFLKSLVS